jgi:hypothetical protein
MYIFKRNLVFGSLTKKKVVRSFFKLNCGGSSKLLNFLALKKKNQCFLLERYYPQGFTSPSVFIHCVCSFMAIFLLQHEFQV